MKTIIENHIGHIQIVAIIAGLALGVAAISAGFISNPPCAPASIQTQALDHVWNSLDPATRVRLVVAEGGAL